MYLISDGFSLLQPKMDYPNTEAPDSLYDSLRARCFGDGEDFPSPAVEAITTAPKVAAGWNHLICPAARVMEIHRWGSPVQDELQFLNAYLEPLPGCGFDEPEVKSYVESA